MGVLYSEARMTESLSELRCPLRIFILANLGLLMWIRIDATGVHSNTISIDSILLVTCEGARELAV